MNRTDYGSRLRMFKKPAPFFQETVLLSNHCARGRGTQAHNHIRSNVLEFRLQPGFAGKEFGIGWFLMDAPLAAFFEFEVLYGIRYVDVRAIDTGLLHSPVQQAACRADERLPSEIFFIAGLLADHHDTRARPSLAEYGLRGMSVEIATAALLDGISERFEIGVHRHKWRRTGCFRRLLCSCHFRSHRPYSPRSSAFAFVNTRRRLAGKFFPARLM